MASRVVTYTSTGNRRGGYVVCGTGSQMLRDGFAQRARKQEQNQIHIDEQQSSRREAPLQIDLGQEQE